MFVVFIMNSSGAHGFSPMSLDLSTLAESGHTGTLLGIDLRSIQGEPLASGCQELMVAFLLALVMQPVPSLWRPAVLTSSL